MSAPSLLIRLLLSFAMILNGSVAVAGVMPGMAGAGEASQAEVAVAGAGDCHEVDMPPPVAESNTGPAHHAAAYQHAGDSSDHTTPDCCKSGMCQCACVQATASLELKTPPFLTIATPALVSFVDSGVAPEHAPRLDRPPIA